jgi:murein DD-endopeptidase MepM/ murein hydrolase activator NlpD
VDSRKIIANLFLTLSFWIGLVLVLLNVHTDFIDKGLSEPIAVTIEESDSGQAYPASAIKEHSETVDNNGPNINEPETAEIYTLIAGEIKRGESLDLAMKRLKVSDVNRFSIIKGFGSSLDFKTLQPGDQFTIQLDKNNSISSAIYEAGPLNTHILQKSEGGIYKSSRQAVPLELRLERLTGFIETSLYAAFLKLREEPKLIHAYADIFASKVDFNTETRKGDRFELLVEKYYKGDLFVGYGKILVASYQNQNILYQGYHYNSEETPAGYFDQNGEALGTWFIRSPIPFGRVTSRFTMRRKHPVDGVIKPHLGVDLAAPRGTPVMATAEGKVEFIGRKGGYGKAVILKHHGGYKTYYGHLHGYKKGLKKGSSVQQKDIIGYVGSTGISTGPHLDYRIQLNRIFRNPFGIKFKAKTVLKDDELARFLLSSGELAKLFDAETDENILQVKNITLTGNNSISFL